MTQNTPSHRGGGEADDPTSGARAEPEPPPDAETSAAPRPGHRRTLFTIPFKSSMTDADVARLHTALDLVTYISPKPGVSGASAGVVPLDFWSGLFLGRGNGENEWLLEARTWGNPPESIVHEWHVRAALAARELDPTVQVPRPERVAAAQIPTTTVGRASNKRLSRFARRLLRLE